MNYQMAIRLLAGLFLTTVTFVQAQQPAKIPRVGVLLYGTPENDPNVEAFRQNMRDLGYTEGEKFVSRIPFRWRQTRSAYGVAAELARLNPDVILALGGDVVPSRRKQPRRSRS